MGSGTEGGRAFRPSHFGAWDKLQNGWIGYEIIEADTTNYVLLAQSDTTLMSPAKALILNVSDETPGPGTWLGPQKEYFIMANRTPIGFDETIAFGDETFSGGMVAWHYDGAPQFANGHNIRVVEADITADLLEGNLGTTDTTKTDKGAISDFYPGEANVVILDDNTIPSLNMASGLYSHYRLSGISYNSFTREVEIDSILTSNLISIISQNTTWSEDVTLTEELFVTANATLTINPGVVVTVDPTLVSNLRIMVEAGSQLMLNGTLENPIVFEATADTSDSIWQGIMIEDSSSYSLSYVTIKNARLG